jgi:hypothetical protein
MLLAKAPKKILHLKNLILRVLNRPISTKLPMRNYRSLRFLSSKVTTGSRVRKEDERTQNQGPSVRHTLCGTRNDGWAGLFLCARHRCYPGLGSFGRGSSFGLWRPDGLPLKRVYPRLALPVAETGYHRRIRRYPSEENAENSVRRKNHCHNLYIVVDQQERWESAVLPEPSARALDPLLIGELKQDHQRKWFVLDQFELTAAE